MGLFGKQAAHRQTATTDTANGLPPAPHPTAPPRDVGLARWLPVVPLLVVTAFATYGQTLYGIDAYSPTAWPIEQRMAVAVGVALGLESIGNYVQWHAHDALLMRATATAARLRRASYLIALGIAAINYSHFADPDWRPTPAAIVFAAFSAAGPWLWGLHTRRAQRVQLTREGHIDASGATFSAERWRAFPLRTWGARRWSIDHSITDPREAWESYRAARVDRVDSAAAEGRPGPLERIAGALTARRSATAAESGPEGESTLPDRRGAVDTSDLEALCADLRAVADQVGRTLSQDEVRQVYGIGARKAGEARRELNWYPRAVERSTEAVASA